jgi:hypothetical protein
MNIFDEIQSRHDYQEFPYSEMFDDEQVLNAWREAISVYGDRVSYTGSDRRGFGGVGHHVTKPRRESLVRIATLALAALELFDNKQGAGEDTVYLSLAAGITR